jgi:hypothetical protein
MHCPLFLTDLLAVLAVLTPLTQALPSSAPENSNAAPTTLKPRVTKDVITHPFMCPNDDLPEGNYPEGFSKHNFQNRRDLCFLNDIVGNVGCICANFQPRAYCPGFFGNPALRAAFGELCENTCTCLYHNLPAGNDDDFNDLEELESTDPTSGRSVSSRFLSRLMSGASMASLRSYEAESEGNYPSTPTEQCSGSCTSMTQCGEECQCGFKVSKYVEINPFFPAWTCIPSVAKQALAAAAVGTVLNRMRPKTHHRPGYIGLGGRDIAGDDDDDEEEEPEEGEGEGEGGRDLIEDEATEWACPCNSTFAHGACCETRQGEVWNVPNLLSKLEM